MYYLKDDEMILHTWSFSHLWSFFYLFPNQMCSLLMSRDRSMGHSSVIASNNSLHLFTDWIIENNLQVLNNRQLNKLLYFVLCIRNDYVNKTAQIMTFKEFARFFKFSKKELVFIETCTQRIYLLKLDNILHLLTILEFSVCNFKII